MTSVAVWGAGAIGGTTAGRLVRAGVDLVAVDLWDERIAGLNDGATIVGLDETFEVPVPTVAPDEVSGPFDVVLLAVKSGFTQAALDDVAPRLGEDGLVVSVQNGLNEHDIADRLGAHRTIGCVVGFGATAAGPDRFEQTSPGGFQIGYLSGARDERLEEVATLLRRGIETEITDNVLGHLWAKLIVNCVIAVAAVNGSTVGGLVQGPERNKLICIDVAREALRAARAAGVTVEKFGGMADPALMEPETDGEYEEAFVLLDALGDIYGDIYPSVLQDIDRGVASEIDHINGRVVATADDHGVDTPVNAAVVRMIHEIEDGSRERGGDNLDHLASTAGLER